MPSDESYTDGSTNANGDEWKASNSLVETSLLDESDRPCFEKKIDETINKSHVKRHQDENWFEKKHTKRSVQVLHNKFVDVYRLFFSEMVNIASSTFVDETHNFECTAQFRVSNLIRRAFLVSNV